MNSVTQCADHPTINQNRAATGVFWPRATASVWNESAVPGLLKRARLSYELSPFSRASGHREWANIGQWYRAECVGAGVLAAKARQCGHEHGAARWDSTNARCGLIWFLNSRHAGHSLRCVSIRLASSAGNVPMAYGPKFSRTSWQAIPPKWYSRSRISGDTDQTESPATQITKATAPAVRVTRRKRPRALALRPRACSVPGAQGGQSSNRYESSFIDGIVVILDLVPAAG